MHSGDGIHVVMVFMWSLQRTDMPTYLAQRLRASSDELSVQWCNGLVRALPTLALWELSQMHLGASCMFVDAALHD